MKKFLLLFLVACSDPEPYTFGDSYHAVSGAWCARSNQCGFNDYIPGCWEHAYVHACKVDGPDRCATEFPEEAREETDACVEATLAAECGPALYWGELPVECEAIQSRWFDIP